MPGLSPSASACEPYLDFIEISRSKGGNTKAIYQDRVDNHGCVGRYQSVKRFVRQLRGRPGPQDCAIIVTPPGEEAQVDYGSGDRWSATHTMAATAALGCLCSPRSWSRKKLRLLTFKSSSRTWAEFHEQAFRRLGGLTRIVVLDNLAEGVLKPDIYDPTRNPLLIDNRTQDNPK